MGAYILIKALISHFGGFLSKKKDCFYLVNKEYTTSYYCTDNPLVAVSNLGGGGGGGSLEFLPGHFYLDHKGV